jgi:hypothetical protein
MKVCDLVKALSEVPQDAEVLGVFDGAARLGIHHVWLSNSGYVLLADEESPVYYDEDRPVSGPTVAQSEPWLTPRVTPEDDDL